MAQPEPLRDSPPVEEPFADLTSMQSEVRALVNSETAEAKREIEAKIDHVKTEAKALVVAISSMLLAAATLIATLIAVLALWLPVWAGAGIATVALTVLSLVLFSKISIKSEDIIPVHTLGEVRRDLDTFI